MKSFVVFVLLATVCFAADSTYKAPKLSDVQPIQVAPTTKSPAKTPDLLDIQPTKIEPATRPPVKKPELPDVESRGVVPPERKGFDVPKWPDIQPGKVAPLEHLQATQATLPDIGDLSSAELRDFRGGLNLSSYKTKLAPNQATVLENALWNEQGEMYKRPGCTEHSTPPFNPNFLYAYYKQDGEEFTMGGSDTSLHFWHEDSSGDGWTYLIGTEGTSGRWDGTTFEDMFVGTHEGVAPVIWDGSTLISVGEQSYSYDSSWAANCSLYVHVENVAWDDDQFVGFYAVQASGTYSDSVLPFGQIVHNDLDVLVIRSNLSSGVNPWGADQNVTILSALGDSVWVAGIIDTFYTMSDQREVLVPSADSSRVEWTEVPGGDCYSTINDYPDTTSHDDYSYTTDTTSVMMVGFGNHTSALVDVGRVWLNIIASTNIDQEIGTAVMVAVRLCFQDSNEYFSWLWQVDQGLENFPYDKKYTRFQVPMSTNPAGHPWTDEGVDSLTLYMMATNQAGGGFGFGDQRLEVFDAWIAVEYEAEALACGFMVFDTSLFDTGDLLDTDITVPTYFELIPEGYDGTPGSPSKTTRQIIDIDSGIYVDAANPTVGNFAYLKLAEPEISGLAVGDSFQLRQLYFPASKYCEIFDKCLWLGWTGTGVNQNKNEIIYSEPSDIGNWPPANQIYLPENGDYITGMKSLSDARHVDVPSHLLMVTQNASSYKIVPTSTAGLYDSWYISTRIGCVSNSAMAVGEGLVLFPDQSGVWAWDQRSKPQCISLLIDPIFEDLALANLEDMSAIYNPQDRHYYLSGPEFFEETYPGGEFICVFEMDSAQQKDGFYIHHFDSEGNETGDDLWQFYYTAGDFLDIATKSDGEYAIMYKRSSGETGYKVFIAFFDEDGAQIGDTLRLDDGGEDTGYAKNADHKFAMNGAGQIIACWTDTEGLYDDVRCQCVDFDAGLVGSNFNVNSDHATNIDDYVSWGIGINEEGFAVIAWEDQRDNENITEIYAQRFQYPDSLMDGNFRVNKCWTWSGTACVPCEDNPVCNGYNCCEHEYKPAVAVGPRTFVIAWVSHGAGVHARCAGASCLYKRAYNNNDGCAREDEYLLSDCTDGNRQEPSISINSKGNYVITYNGECGEGATYAIYMAVFDSSDRVRIVETQVSSADESQQASDVVINNNDIIVVVWYDGYHDEAVEIASRSYNWNGTFMSSDFILSSSAYCEYPEIDCFLNPPDTSLYTLAWNIDYRGWSKESFSASAYAYQHGLTDPVKVIFADPEETKIYDYGTQADDVNDAVIFTYQTGYFSFTQDPTTDTEIKFWTLEADLDTGTVNYSWYRDYSILAQSGSITCGQDCREEIDVPADSVSGRNVSLYLETDADNFTLSRICLEYRLNKNRK